FIRNSPCYILPENSTSVWYYFRGCLPPDWLNYSVMYLIAEQQFVLFPLVFWVLANDVFKISQSKRLFPLISGWSFVGKLVGIGIAAVSPALFLRLNIQPEEILTFNILIYMVSYMVVLIGLRNVTVRKTVQKTETVRETLQEGFDFIREVASFKFLMIAIALLAFADTIIEFRFLVATDSEFTSQATYQQFFSLYRLGTTLAALFIQAMLTGRIIKSMQLKNTFLILPITVLVSLVGMMLVPGMPMAIAGMVLVKLVRDTLNESGRKSFQGLVPEERRGRVSTVMETYLPSIGTIMACIIAGGIVIIGIWQNVDVYLYYLSAAVLGGVTGFWAILKMRSHYDSSLLNWRMKRRQRKGSTMLLKKLDKLSD
ncbi:MAG: hypothetical protein FVQ83_14225, partial [Chloroflexi bacterium]|nr:hypothetical protein [Chloroflexota bacterium]